MKKYIWLRGVAIFAIFFTFIFYFLLKGTFETELDRQISYLYQKLLYTARNIVDPSFAAINRIPIPARSPIKIDVIIPVVEKDLPTVQHTIDSVHRMVMHPLGKIFLIAPDSQKIRALAQEKGCIFVLEDSLLPEFKTRKRPSGWILQQFLKLSADSIAEQEHFLVVDADTIFIRPQVFITPNNKYLLNLHWDYGAWRKSFTKKVLGISHHYRLDFVCHHMLLRKQWLQELKKEIEKQHKAAWMSALLELVEHDPTTGFSEYDIYGTFVYDHYAREHKLVADANLTLYRDRLEGLQDFKAAFARDYKSVSLHHFILADY